MGAAVIRIVTAAHLAELRECIRLHEELGKVRAASIAIQGETIRLLQEMLASREGVIEVLKTMALSAESWPDEVH